MVRANSTTRYHLPMNVVAVPYFMGQPMADFEVPEPHHVLTPELSGADPLYRMGRICSELADYVADAERPVSYAGDCISAIGVLAGLQRKKINPTLIWLDAHGDFNTPWTSPTGFPGGMPLAMLTGRGHQSIVKACDLTPLQDERVVLVDARSIDPGEDETLAESRVKHVTLEELPSNTPGVGPLYVHLDADIVDPSEMPAMNYSAPKGPSLESVRVALATLAKTGRVVALSVSSWNPALPGADVAAKATHTLVSPFITAD